MEQFSTVRLQIWSVHMILRYLHLEHSKIPYGTDLAPFGVLTLFGPTKLGGLITMEPDVNDICNLSGLCCIMMSNIWQCANLQFLSENGPMGMGQFRVPKIAVGP